MIKLRTRTTESTKGRVNSMAGLDEAVKALTCKMIQDERERRDRGEPAQCKPGSLQEKIVAYVDTLDGKQGAAK